MFIVMLFTLGLVAQTATAPAVPADKAACACCDHSSADMKDCCKDGKCNMKDGKMADGKACCKDMAKGESCCKDGKCEMAKADAKSDKGCCGKSCKMKHDTKAS